VSADDKAARLAAFAQPPQTANRVTSNDAIAPPPPRRPVAPTAAPPVLEVEPVSLPEPVPVVPAKVVSKPRSASPVRPKSTATSTSIQKAFYLPASLCDRLREAAANAQCFESDLIAEAVNDARELLGEPRVAGRPANGRKARTRLPVGETAATVTLRLPRGVATTLKTLALAHNKSESAVVAELLRRSLPR
jgi:hypothetical protein